MWSGLFLVLRGQSAVVRVGGGLVLSLGLMALAISPVRSAAVLLPLLVAQDASD